MKIRFVEGSEFDSQAIIALEKVALPFTPSHVEAVTPDGFYLGAMFSGGVQKRPIGYDNGKFNNEKILTLEATADQDKLFYGYLEKHIDEPYDWEAILGFLIPENFHNSNHTICSALITQALRASSWFRFQLAVHSHLVDPRDLLLMISVQMQVI